MNLLRLRKGPIVGISKRISVPENFAYFAAQAQQQPNLPQSQVLFQQRLLQQQQKRAAAAAAVPAGAAAAPVAAGMRHRSGSWSTRHAASKYLQHQVRREYTVP